ncbi:hypothetical protein BDR03DRAFT_971770 [Suillus americanus]|nr:hypothetical protein BDR03DRAFT_971770 [Suillus americanus]
MTILWFHYEDASYHNSLQCFPSPVLVSTAQAFMTRKAARCTKKDAAAIILADFFNLYTELSLTSADFLIAPTCSLINRIRKVCKLPDLERGPSMSTIAFKERAVSKECNLVFVDDREAPTKYCMFMFVDCCSSKGRWLRKTHRNSERGVEQ